MKYFVTGGTGFIGAHLIRRLVQDGHEVFALVRNAETRLSIPGPGHIETVYGDITSKSSMRAAMAECDRVFHLAGWYRIGVRKSTEAYRVNVEGTRNVLELMREFGIEKGVYTSSVAVFSDTRGAVVDESYQFTGAHLSVYDCTKWHSHYDVAEPMMQDGLPLVVVQPGAVYGPGDRGPTWMFWKPYLQGNLRVIPARTGFCWGHVEDTVDGHLLAMENGVPGESYIIAGEPYRLEDVFQLATEITGIDTPRVISPAFFRRVARIMTPIERIVNVPPAYSAESLRILGGVTYWGDNSKAKRTLGLEHRPLRTGLQETLLSEREYLEA